MGRPSTTNYTVHPRQPWNKMRFFFLCDPQILRRNSLILSKQDGLLKNICSIQKFNLGSTSQTGVCEASSKNDLPAIEKLFLIKT